MQNLSNCEFVPSDDAGSISESIERRGIASVWHLTRITHLSNIFRVGALLSRSQMDSIGINYGMSGWGTDSKVDELRDYICCSIVCPWGMSQENPTEKALIRLQPRVLLRKGVLFCGMWSSFNEIATADLLNNNTIQDFDLMFENETSSFPAPPPGEFLVPACIPYNEFVDRIYLYDDDTRKAAVSSCGSIQLPSGDTVENNFKFVADKYCFRGRA